MKLVLDIIDTISEYTGRFCRWAVVVLASVMCFEVFSRYVLNRPTIWSFETSIMLYAFFFMMCASYALLYKAHVAIDFFYERLTKKGQAILDIISTTLFFFPFLIVVLVEGTKFALDSWMILETSWSDFAPPLYPIKTVIPVTALLLLLQGFAGFYRNIQIVLTGECYEPKYKEEALPSCAPIQYDNTEDKKINIEKLEDEKND